MIELVETISLFSSGWMPHIGAGLVVACLALVLAGKLGWSAGLRTGVFFAVFLLVLVPVGPYGLSHYVRVITGDLSATGFVLLVTMATTHLWRPIVEERQVTGIAVALLLAALVLYPTALGLTRFDLYSYGYYPIVLGPLMLAVMVWFIWLEMKLPAIILGVAFASFSMGLLESDNLWDYLIDPVVLVYALVVSISNRNNLQWPKLTQRHIEMFLGFLVGSFLLFAIYLAQVNHDVFRNQFVVEDGFVEWCTVVILFTTMIVCLRRFVLLRKVRSPLFLGVTLLLALLCLFGAGEEISWGQRIFDIETPEYLKGKNAQDELGLHNLVIEVDGERVKLNKLIFGTGLALALLIYLFIATPLYRKQPVVTRFFNAIAAPMPRNYQIVGYLLVVAVVELLIDSSKRGEMTEFAGSIVFALNVIYPYNPELFDPDKLDDKAAV